MRSGRSWARNRRTATRPTPTMPSAATTGISWPSTPNIGWSWPSSRGRDRSRMPRPLSRRPSSGWVISTPTPHPPQRGPGRPPVTVKFCLPQGLCYATVHKHRKNGQVVAIEQKQVFGTAEDLKKALNESAASSVVNTSFVERQHATDRGKNARKSRRTYRFSKDWKVHEAVTYLTLYGYNFCWCVRTLRVQDDDGHWRERTPAMAAGLTDHVWTWREWFMRPAIQSS
jgi:hypothetical protein